MADPLSTVASIVGLLVATGKAIDICAGFNHLQQWDSQYTIAFYQLQDLRDILTGLESVLNPDEPITHAGEGIVHLGRQRELLNASKHLRTPLESLQATMLKLQGALLTFNAKRGSKNFSVALALGRRMKEVTDIDELFQAMIHQKSTLVLALSILQW